MGRTSETSKNQVFFKVLGFVATGEGCLMGTAISFLVFCWAIGVRLWVAGDAIEYAAPRVDHRTRVLVSAQTPQAADSLPA
jgi:hypothetical protein